MASALARRRAPVFAIAIAFAVAAIAVFIDRRSVWLDEADSVYFAMLPQPALLHALLHVDGVFALYYSILHGLTAFGHSAPLLRGFSACCAILSIVPVYAVAERLYGRGAAAVAIALYIAHIQFLYYATEIRPYALTLLFCALAAWLFVHIALDSGTRWTIAYVLAAVLAVYSHPIASLFVAAQAVSLYFIKPQVKNIRALAIAYAVIAALAVPQIVLAHANGTAQIDWISKPGVSSARNFVEGLLGPPVLAAMLAALACFTALRAPLKEKTGTLVLLTWAVIPITAAIAISTVAPASIFVARYVLYTLVPIVILSARGLLLAPERLRIATAIVLAAALAQGLWNLGHYQGENWRAAVSYVRANAKSGDPRIVFKGMAAVPYQYAFAEKTGSADDGVLYPSRAVFDRHAVPPATFFARLSGMHGRLWLIVSHALPLRQEPSLKPLLRNFRAIRTRHFSGVDVLLLDRAAGA